MNSALLLNIIITLITLSVFPVYAEPYSVRKSFIGEVINGIEEKNFDALNNLYCEKTNSQSKTWGVFREESISVSVAIKHHPLHDVENQIGKFDNTLQVCFETKQSKELCQILPISVSASDICIKRK